MRASSALELSIMIDLRHLPFGRCGAPFAALLTSGTGCEIFLIDQRDDRARNYIPVRADRKRDHRLDVEQALLTRPITIAVIVVVLERNADEARDRVRELPGKVGTVRRSAACIRGLCKCDARP